MSTQYPVLNNRPIHQWKVAELKEELKRRKLTTRGLKDDLIKRLDEAIHSEMKAFEDEARPDFDCKPEPMVNCEDAGAKPSYIETADNRNYDENKTGKVDEVAAVVDLNDGPTEVGKGKVQEEESNGGTDSVVVVGESAVLDASVETSSTINQIVVTQTASSEKALENNEIKMENEDLKPPQMDAESIGVTDSVVVVGEVVFEASGETSSTINQIVVTQTASSEKALENNEIKMENEDLKPPQMDAVLDVSIPNNQVHEVSPVLGFQVKSESISTDSVSIYEKNELKDNLNADNVHLELGVVKPEMVQPSSGEGPSNGGNLHPLDDQKPSENPSSVEESDDNKSTHVDLSKKNDSPDGGSPVKLNLELYPADDSMEEDVLEDKPTDSNQNPDEVGVKIDLTEVPVTKDGYPIDAVWPDLSPDKMETSAEMKYSIPPTAERRKLQDDNKSTHADLSKKPDMADGESSEKLNLDHSSADDSMEEDVLETKQIDSNHNSDEVRDKIELTEACGAKVGGIVDDVRSDFSSDKMETSSGKKDNVAAPEKRKFQDEAVENKEPPKRQRRWNSESLKIPEPQSSNLTTPKDSFQTTISKRNLTRSDSTVSGVAPKERVVPPSPKPLTNSLRIDRFLRPFTLKAVQELLAKTGNICSFWMDNIKTHCYVMYSSVEEANETRNAVYNLQWPPNGGHLLVAEFVDPQEVKLRVEAPPRSPAAPVSTSPTVLAGPAPIQPSSSTRQHGLRQHLPPPPPFPQLPPISDPPTIRERLSLPSPPPLPEEVDPPIVTLDDLFRKTRATPRIYYLPLSEEQVAAKLAMQGNNTKR